MASCPRIDLAAAAGHPSAVMDMSFANQAPVVEYLATRGRDLPPDVHSVPAEVDNAVAYLKLSAMGLTIDALTAEQQTYLGSWREGT